MRLSLSTSFHRQTDGQMEFVNFLVIQFIRMYNHKNFQTWDDNLPYIHHSYNRAQHRYTGKSSFEICYIYKHSAPIDLIISLTQSNDTDFKGLEVEKALKFRDKIYNIYRKAQEMLQ